MSKMCNGYGDCDVCHNLNCKEWVECDICDTRILDDKYFSIDGSDYHKECFEDRYEVSQ